MNIVNGEPSIFLSWIPDLEDIWNWFKKYWIELGVFIGILTYYIVGIAPVMTFMSMAGDGYDYVVGATNMWSVRPTGYPTYVLFGWLFERLPGDPFWSLGLFSALCAFLTCIVIYLCVHHLTKNRLASIIGSLTYSGSFLVWTQAVVPQMRCFNTLLMVTAIYFVLKNKWYLAAVMLALGVGVHHTIIWVLFPIVCYLLYLKYKREESVALVNIWVFLGIICFGFLAYLQTIFCLHDQETTSGIRSIFGQSGGSLGFAFALPLVKTWQRITEAVPLLLTGLGAGLVLLFFTDWKKREIVLIGIIALLNWCYYFFSNIPMWTFYAVPAFAFGSILIGVGASRFHYSKKWLAAFIVVPVIFCGINLARYDIGRTVDPTPTGAQRCYEVLDIVPDDSILYIQDGETWLLTYYYAVENNDRFLFMFSGELKYHTKTYYDWKTKQGIVLPTDLDKYGTWSRNKAFYVEWDDELFLNDIVELNPEKEVYIVERYGQTFEGLDFTITRFLSSSRTDNLIP